MQFQQTKFAGYKGEYPLLRSRCVCILNRFRTVLVWCIHQCVSGCITETFVLTFRYTILQYYWIDSERKCKASVNMNASSVAECLGCLTFFPEVGFLIWRLTVQSLIPSSLPIGFPLLSITYSVIKGQLLSYHVFMVWEVKDFLSQ